MSITTDVQFKVYALTVSAREEHEACLYSATSCGLVIHLILEHNIKYLPLDDNGDVANWDKERSDYYGCKPEVFLKEGLFSTLRDAEQSMELIDDCPGYRPRIIRYAMLANDPQIVNVGCSLCGHTRIEPEESEDDDEEDESSEDDEVQ